MEDVSNTTSLVLIWIKKIDGLGLNSGSSGQYKHSSFTEHSLQTSVNMEICQYKYLLLLANQSSLFLFCVGFFHSLMTQFFILSKTGAFIFFPSLFRLLSGIFGETSNPLGFYEQQEVSWL